MSGINRYPNPSLVSRFALTAVSPAVVVPSLLTLSDAGYGLDKGIPTLVIAAATIDDVFNITGFGVLLGIVFSQGIEKSCQSLFKIDIHVGLYSVLIYIISILVLGELALTIAKGPLEMLLGIVYGLVFGVFLWYFPSKDNVSS